MLAGKSKSTASGAALLIVAATLIGAAWIVLHMAGSGGQPAVIPPNVHVAHGNGQQLTLNVRDYGAVGDGKADDTSAIAGAIAAAISTGANVVYIPAGTYKTTAAIVPVDDIWICGAGVDRTVILPMGTAGLSAFYLKATPEYPLTNFTLSDLTIDGTNVVTTSWDPWTKGIYISYMKDCVLKNLLVYNTSATGIGTDFMVDCRIENCVADRCGRDDADGKYRGGNGIGIGTGGYPIENTTIVSCVARDCGNNGIMFENQEVFGHNPSLYFTRAGSVIDCLSLGNTYGFRDTGDRDISFINCSAINNTRDGILLERALGFIEEGIVISNCTIEGNARGISIDSINESRITGCTIRNNRISGIHINGTCYNLRISGNAMLDNGNDIAEGGAGGIFLG